MTNDAINLLSGSLYQDYATRIEPILTDVDTLISAAKRGTDTPTCKSKSKGTDNPTCKTKGGVVKGTDCPPPDTADCASKGTNTPTCKGKLKGTDCPPPQTDDCKGKVGSPGTELEFAL